MAKKTEAPKKENPSKALAPRPTNVPAKTGKAVGGRGLENLERQDILLPRLKLLQPLSPEVTGELELKAGTIFQNLTQKNYGEKITITPILHFRSRIKWNPIDDDGGIDCSSPDAKKPLSDKYSHDCASCSHAQWDNEAKEKKDAAPKCTLYENFLVLVNDETEPIILSMERTKQKVAKKFYSMAALRGGDFWGHLYTVTVVKEKNDKNQAYFNYSVADAGKIPAPERQKLAESIWTNLQGKTLTSEQENPEAEEAGKAAAEKEPAGKF